MKTELNKKIILYIDDPNNPNKSMGNIISFKKEGETVAHLSLSWDAKLWFGYYLDGKFKNIHFPFYFNDYSFNDKSLHIEFYLNDSSVIICQNNLCKMYKLETVIEFDEYELIENFKNFDIDKIDNNNYDVEFIDNKIENNKYTNDIIITSYQCTDNLKSLLNSILNTYYDNDFMIINNIIFCDNNSKEEYTLELKDIINKYSKYFNCIYIENEDKTYINNRITGIYKSLEKCYSDIVTIIDNDVIFINKNWINTYSLYNLIPDLKGASSVSDQIGSHYFRDSQIILPRFHPCFFHCKTEYLKDMIRFEDNVLGDFKITSNYKNIELNIMGLHFSKLYAISRSNMDKFYVFDSYEIITLDKINNISYSMIENIICIHFENSSFKEVWKNKNYVSFRNNKVISSMKKLFEYNLNQNILYCFFNSEKDNFLKILEKEIEIGSDKEILCIDYDNNKYIIYYNDGKLSDNNFIYYIESGIYNISVYSYLDDIYIDIGENIFILNNVKNYKIGLL